MAASLSLFLCLSLPLSSLSLSTSFLPVQWAPGPRCSWPALSPASALPPAQQCTVYSRYEHSLTRGDLHIFILKTVLRGLSSSTCPTVHSVQPLWAQSDQRGSTYFHSKHSVAGPALLTFGGTPLQSGGGSGSIYRYSYKEGQLGIGFKSTFLFELCNSHVLLTYSYNF